MKTSLKVPVLVAALASQLAYAGPMLESLNYARFYGANDPRMIMACENSSGVACNGSAIAPGTNWTVNYYAYGTGSFGIMKNRADVVLTGDNSGGDFPSFASVGSRSGFIDTYTFTGGTGQGIALFNFAISGTAEAGGGGAAGSLFQYVPMGSNGFLDWNNMKSFGLVNGAYTIPVPFQFGVPTEFLLTFYALAQVWSFEEGTYAHADYSHTAVLNQISVRGSQGQLLPDFGITSASGTKYTSMGVVPEPSTSILLVVALALLALVRRRVPSNCASF